MQYIPKLAHFLHLTRRRILAATVLCGALTVASVARADNYDLGPGPAKLRGIFRQLDLTADQRTQLKAVVDAHATALKNDAAAVATANTTLRNYLKSGGSDSTEIATYVTAISTSVGTLETEEAATFVDAYALLTADQKTTLAQSQNTPPTGEHGPHRGRRQF